MDVGSTEEEEGEEDGSIAVRLVARRRSRASRPADAGVDDARSSVGAISRNLGVISPAVWFSELYVRTLRSVSSALAIHSSGIDVSEMASTMNHVRMYRDAISRGRSSESCMGSAHILMI